jgi:DNA-directed RNA polymerase subunit RPC12/RpoP
LPKIIGIYKELSDGEEVLSETPDFVRVESESNPFGTDYFDAKVYLTSKKLLFLIATSLNVKKAKQELAQISKDDPFLTKSVGILQNLSVGKQKEDSSTIVSTWMEIPLEMVRKMETPSGFFADNKSQLIVEFDVANKKGVLGVFRKNPKVIIHLDNRDMWKTVVHNALQKHRVNLGKELGGPQLDGEGNYVCATCGTHYEQDRVKMIKCKKCESFVCKEKLIGSISKKWEKSKCFVNSKFVCISCSKI